jgi:hypothetical protein
MSDPHTTPRFASRSADDPTYDVDPGRGWVLFAGVMLSIIGVLNLVYGIAAISDSTFYVLPAQPVWAIMVFFVDVIIIFGLLTYGGRDRHNLA